LQGVDLALLVAIVAPRSGQVVSKLAERVRQPFATDASLHSRFELSD
jgi:hypothetical protein